jgi:hypothetical protein
MILDVDRQGLRIAAIEIRLEPRSATGSAAVAGTAAAVARAPRTRVPTANARDRVGEGGATDGQRATGYFATASSAAIGASFQPSGTSGFALGISCPQECEISRFSLSKETCSQLYPLHIGPGPALAISAARADRTPVAGVPPQAPAVVSATATKAPARSWSRIFMFIAYSVSADAP